MPKRKDSMSREKDIDRYKNKIRKLERKIREQQISVSKNLSDTEEDVIIHDEDSGTDTLAVRSDDLSLECPPEDDTIQNLNETCEQPGPSTAAHMLLEEPAQDTNCTELDPEILEILGKDPTNTHKFGPAIRKELANRLLYVVKEGLGKKTRKKLISKYLMPKNCIELNAPKINLEIKTAIADTSAKRDKDIGNKQKQMSSAIACLADVINSHVNSKSINNDVLQKLMDTSRILCDLQHTDSLTRRNLILSALKNDMKDHLKNTKIDSFLFGENLVETLKSAKAVNKSGTELKAEPCSKTADTNFRGPASRALNRKAPTKARGPPAGSAPSSEPVIVRAQYRPPHSRPQHQPQHAHSSKISRRRY